MNKKKKQLTTIPLGETIGCGGHRFFVNDGRRMFPAVFGFSKLVKVGAPGIPTATGE